MIRLPFFFLLIALIVVVLVFWIRELIFLMSLGDKDFPGKHDKALWLVLFVVLFFIAPFIFRSWRKFYLDLSR
jgi:hypothetical protein